MEKKGRDKDKEIETKKIGGEGNVGIWGGGGNERLR